MTRSIPYFGEGAAIRKGVADEGVPAVMDGQRFQPILSEIAAGGAKTLPESMLRKSPKRVQRRSKWGTRTGAARHTIGLPDRYVLERPGIPPERNRSRLPALGDATSNSQMGTRRIDSKVAKLSRAISLARKPQQAAGEIRSS